MNRQKKFYQQWQTRPPVRAHTSIAVANGNTHFEGVDQGANRVGSIANPRALLPPLLPPRPCTARRAFAAGVGGPRSFSLQGDVCFLRCVGSVGERARV